MIVGDWVGVIVVVGVVLVLRLVEAVTDGVALDVHESVAVVVADELLVTVSELLIVPVNDKDWDALIDVV